MKKIIKNILIFISYFVYEILLISLLSLFKIDYFKLSKQNKILMEFILNIIFIIFLIIVYRKEYKKDLKDFKKNGLSYIFNNLYLYIIGLFLMGLSNSIISNITNLEVSGNESSVREALKLFPVYMSFSSIIYAPFVEETIFRKSIRNIFKNDILFVFISGFLFGILHISDFTNFNQILMGIPYIFMGLSFAYIYKRTNNIFTTMSIHSMHNLILVLMQFL